jgi:hypothetical protein
VLGKKEDLGVPEAPRRSRHSSDAVATPLFLCLAVPISRWTSPGIVDRDKAREGERHWGCWRKEGRATVLLSSAGLRALDSISGHQQGDDLCHLPSTSSAGLRLGVIHVDPPYAGRTVTISDSTAQRGHSCWGRARIGA